MSASEHSLASCPKVILRQHGRQTRRFLATTTLLAAGVFGPAPALAQDLDFAAARAEVDFSRTLQPWDGFGFNNVETAHAYSLSQKSEADPEIRARGQATIVAFGWG